jgi:alpha-glucosidase
LKTDRLLLRYKKNSGQFNPDNLSIELALNGKTVRWHPGLKNDGNLGGTIRTLDGVRGDTKLEPGLVSRDGWVLIDDSVRPLFDNSDWPWVVPRHKAARQDWYFFGHSHDYKQALKDFTLVAGKIPIPPRFAFGTWWSRYWAYTDTELKQLVNEFEVHDVPLDVLVIDMDWHITFGTKWSDNKKDQSGHTLGWTGYTWNKDFFPDPEGFLSWCKEHGLKSTLNLHPASGVQPHEERYAEMARAMGIDPASNKYVPFDITNKKFAENYLKILHYPLERQGIDFFWLDWQQEQTTPIAGLNPTWWLNYVHTSDMERREKRPLIFHRWGGLGNHRYQIGFSGDTISVWESLAFQPYFTATAANVGYGYWSHDIGGHMPGEVSPELYTRWIQFGAFSPILRTHTTKNPNAERRIWAYPVDYFLTMRDDFLLRYAMIPYLYTAAREAYDTGISICRPMYYDYPELEEAYSFRDEYMFGDSMLVAPISAAASEETKLATKSVWLPEGTWVEWFTGTTLKGPARIDRQFALNEIPVYVKAGSVIPTQPKVQHTGEKPVDPLILSVFPQEAGSARLYEDQGNSLGYKRGECAWTEIRHSRQQDGKLKIEILPAQGSYPGMLGARSYQIRLVGVWPPAALSCNGRPIGFVRKGPGPGWNYEGNTVTAVINTPRFGVRQKVEVLVEMPKDLESRVDLINGFPMKRARLEWAMNQINTQWPGQWSPDQLVQLVQTGNRMEIDPKSAGKELEKFQRGIPEVIETINKMGLAPEVLRKVLAHLRSIVP